MQCPASARMMRDLPDETSDYANEGTVAHFVAAEALRRETPFASTIEYLGKQVVLTDECETGAWVPAGNPDSKVDPAGARYSLMVDHDMVGFINDFLALVRSEHNADPDTHMLVEAPVNLEPMTGELDEDGAPAVGTSDVVLVQPNLKQVTAIDLKYGMGVRVDATNNPQLRMYGSGTLIALQDIYEIERVRTVIHQPRLRHVSFDAYSLAEHDAFLAEVAEAAGYAAALYQSDDEPPESAFGPGEDACRWCTALPQCRAAAASVREAILGDFQLVDRVPITPADALIVEVAAKGLKSEAANVDTRWLDGAMRVAPLVRLWADAVEGAGYKALLGGAWMDNWKLVAGNKGHRAWIDEKAALAALKKAKLSLDEVFSRSIISPPAAEKILKAKAAKPEVWAKMQANIHQSEGKPAMAARDDKRDELIIDIATDFVDETVNDADAGLTAEDLI